MGEDAVDRWLPFYVPFFPSAADARAFVVPLEALRLGDQNHPAKIMMHQAKRLISLSDDLPSIRKDNESLRLLFLLICAENIAKLADGFEGEGSSKLYVRNFFRWFLLPEQQNYLCSAFTRHDCTPLSLQDVADALYGVRCEIVHEGKYWGFHFHDGRIAILNTEPDVIASLTFVDFRKLVVNGCINAISRFPTKPEQGAAVTA